MLEEFDLVTQLIDEHRLVALANGFHAIQRCVRRASRRRRRSARQQADGHGHQILIRRDGQRRRRAARRGRRCRARLLQIDPRVRRRRRRLSSHQFFDVLLAHVDTAGRRTVDVPEGAFLRIENVAFDLVAFLVHSTGAKGEEMDEQTASRRSYLICASACM